VLSTDGKYQAGINSLAVIRTVPGATMPHRSIVGTRNPKSPGEPPKVFSMINLFFINRSFILKVIICFILPAPMVTLVINRRFWKRTLLVIIYQMNLKPFPEANIKKKTFSLPGHSSNLRWTQTFLVLAVLNNWRYCPLVNALLLSHVLSELLISSKGLALRKQLWARLNEIVVYPLP
jgi:hypothetical protein